MPIKSLIKTGRDAHRKAERFRELGNCIAPSKSECLMTSARTVTFDQRDPVDKAKEEASDIRTIC